MTTTDNLLTVVGIEKLGFCPICLKCDTCGNVYNGGNGSTKPGPVMPRGYAALQEQLLQADARMLGWTGPLTRESTTDKCPTCSKEASNEQDEKVG